MTSFFLSLLYVDCCWCPRRILSPGFLVAFLSLVWNQARCVDARHSRNASRVRKIQNSRPEEIHPTSGYNCGNPPLSGEKKDAFLSVEVMHFIISTVKTRPPSSICTNVIFQIKACNSQKITVAQFQV